MCSLRLVGRNASFVSASMVIALNPKMIMRISYWPNNVSVYCEEMHRKIKSFKELPLFIEDAHGANRWRPSNDEVLSKSWEVWEIID